MSFSSLTSTFRLLCRGACLTLMLSAAACSSFAQGGSAAHDRFQWDAAVARTGPEEGRFSFHGKPGFLYRLEYATTGLRSPDLANNLTANDWIPTPQLFYMPSSGTAAAQAAEFNVWLPPIVVTPPGRWIR